MGRIKYDQLRKVMRCGLGEATIKTESGYAMAQLPTWETMRLNQATAALQSTLLFSTGHRPVPREKAHSENERTHHKCIGVPCVPLANPWCWL